MGKFLILKKRKDFLRAAEGVCVVYRHVMLQAARQLSAEKDNKPRIGFTATKRLGNAYYRNRTKRRLRAVLREVYAKLAKNNTDYVLVGRRDTAVCPYEVLLYDTRRAFKKVNKMLKKKALNEKNIPVSD